MATSKILLTREQHLNPPRSQKQERAGYPLAVGTKRLFTCRRYLHVFTCQTTHSVWSDHPANVRSRATCAAHKLFLLPGKQLIAKRIRVTHINNTNMLILISTVESPSDAALERGWEAARQAGWWEAKSQLRAHASTASTQTDGLRRILQSKRC